ncbi:class I SAM-dependent methyltransferase [Pontibaca salina]|uniref:Class I SAM-dependent methyltransferase n=1 Tax=Pontibaca salina TaxID=2795731 RepID=A0A934HLE7_9RHOB|nr:class I SAM-dependent methyltransferase [Pontibaca salina]MBI6630349.1 class I SAM-dependent methyltransferase [Pontibaca salina]
MSARLTLALEAGGLALPETGTISVLSPTSTTDLSALPRDRVQIVAPFKPCFDFFKAQGFDCVAQSDSPCAMAIVSLPRAKAQARKLIADASIRSSGLVVVDGAKTDGIDSILKELRKLLEVGAPLSKAHGKIFWFRAEPEALSDWRPPAQSEADGFATAPGVFSADSIDPASQLLANFLPKRQLGRQVVDLGAGWGYLGLQALGAPQVKAVDFVEADRVALECARLNVPDPRARFHWADATRWTAEGVIDSVIMNPPFHIGRQAEPELGRAFIAAAERILSPSGQLWMVANRHLPYEAALEKHFRRVQETAGDTRFKVLHATRPRRVR